MKINNVGNNSNRELIKTFNRLDQEYSWFDCLSEDESLNDITEANDSIAKVENLIHKRRINIIPYLIDGKEIKELVTVKKVNVLVRDSIIKETGGRYPIGKYIYCVTLSWCKDRRHEIIRRSYN